MDIGPRPPLGRRYLKSFAGGIAHKFSASAEHYAYLAWEHRVPRATIDLLSLAIDPPEFDIPRNRNLAWMCQQSLFSSELQLFPPAKVVKAVLTADFDLVTAWPDVPENSLGPSVYTVTLTDERGKEWRNVCRMRETWMDCPRSDTEAQSIPAWEKHGMSLNQWISASPALFLALLREGDRRPEDLERVASILRVIRRRNPKLTIGQIISAAIPPGKELSRLWDDELIRYLELFMSMKADRGGERS